MSIDLVKFQTVLRQFSTDRLKLILGDNLADTLIEWKQDNAALFTKSNLANMIATVHGVGILKDKRVRAEFLEHISDADILTFKEILPKRLKNISPIEVRTHIAGLSWKDKPEIRHLLSLLNIDENIFTEQNSNDTAEDSVTSPERFYELLDYQFVVKQKMLTELSSNVQLNKMLLQMPTGTGKTKTAMHTIIHHFCFNLKKKGLVIWMAHTTELLYQAYDTFCSVWRHIGNDDVKTFKLFGEFEIAASTEPINGFMFCGFQKLITVLKNNVELFNTLLMNCRLIVVDEAHKAAAPETKKAISSLMTKKHDMNDRALIGLTATPGRNISNSSDIERLVGMFDNKLIDINPRLLNDINLSAQKAANVKETEDIIGYFQQRRILAKLKRKALTYDTKLCDSDMQALKVKMIENGYEDYTKESLEIVGRNKSRNIAILNELIHLYAEKIPTIVFACSVEQGALLSTALSLNGIENACVFGNMASKERATAIKRFKDKNDNLNILINYEVLTTGFDATNIRCVFITRPTKSIVLYSQMIGRGLRGPLMGGNEECLLIDIDDNLNEYPNESFAFTYFKNYWSNN